MPFTRSTLFSLASAVVLLLLALDAQAATLNVPGVYPSIQAAISATNAGDTIVVAAGTYHESLDWESKDLVIQGAGEGLSIIDPSAANGGPGGRCVYTAHLTSASQIAGFTLRNGTTSDVSSGMYNFLSSPTVTHCTFTQNTSARLGGGIYTVIGNMTVTNCTFTHNSAVHGGGMGNTAGSPTVTHCTFTQNTASGTGGGMYDIGGTTTLINCILWGNTAVVDGSGIAGSPTVSYSDVQDLLNTLPDANGNFGADPLFVRNPGTNGATDPGDLHLQSGSPAINAGNDAVVTVPPFPTNGSNLPVDLDGKPRINGAHVDLGAYENQADTTPPVLTLNGSNPLIVLLNTPFVDPGATAMDNVDGSVSVTVSGSVNTSVTGFYTLTYSATDQAGNTASKARTVQVKMGYVYFATVPQVAAHIGQTINLHARLRRRLDNAVLVGKTVSFSLGGQSLGTAVTDSTGQAGISYVLPETLGTGSLPVSVAFAGDGTYYACNGTGTLTIEPGSTYFGTLPGANGQLGKSTSLHAHLRCTSNGLPLVGRTVTFSLDGSVMGTAVTDANGQATCPYAVPMGMSLGAHSFQAQFAGDALYNACTGSGTLTIHP